MDAEWTTTEVVMASVLGAFAIGTFSDQPAVAIAWFFSRMARLAVKRRGSRGA
jgi:hypothetical protein